MIPRRISRKGNERTKRIRSIGIVIVGIIVIIAVFVRRVLAH